MKNLQNNTEKVRKVVYLSVLSAMVVILQLVASGISVGICNLSFVLVPIVIGAAFCGPMAGAWLGFIFSFVVLLQPGTSFFYNFSFPGTIIIVLTKGIMAGLLTGLCYKALSKLNKYLAVMISAIVCPTVNTALFILGCYVFLYQDLAKYAAASGAANVTALIFVGFVGINYFVELGINVILAPVILRLENLKKQH